jgi:hypothetical protein
MNPAGTQAFVFDGPVDGPARSRSAGLAYDKGFGVACEQTATTLTPGTAGPTAIGNLQDVDLSPGRDQATTTCMDNFGLPPRHDQDGGVGCPYAN